MFAWSVWYLPFLGEAVQDREVDLAQDTDIDQDLEGVNAVDHGKLIARCILLHFN